MRYRLMASYEGSPFEAGIGPAENNVVLFAACPPPEELGFEPATGHWRKELRIQDVQAIWESRPVGVFRGRKCIVLDDLGDRLHIGYLGHDAYEAERLGYWQVDRGVFELVAARTEVFDIVEERIEYLARPTLAEPVGKAGRPEPPIQLPPGAPQDQARYLPPELPQDQASYLSAGNGYAPAEQPAFADSTNGYHWRNATDTAGFDLQGPATGIEPVPDQASGVALPPLPEVPLPLEAAALQAASESRRNSRRTSGERRGAAGAAPVPAAAGAESPDSAPGDSQASPAEPAKRVAPTARRSAAAAKAELAARVAPSAAGPAAIPPLAALAGSAAGSALAPAAPAPAPARRHSARRRLATEHLFSELAGLAGIPVDSYAVGEEVEGAMCLLQTEDGFAVFQSSDGKRHEVQFFESEEAACFYLFGLLAAEAVRNGTLGPAAERVIYSTGPLPIVRTGR